MRTRRTPPPPDTAALLGDYYPVRSAKYVKGYLVEFTFADGLVREIELKPFLRGPIYEPWQSETAFREFVGDLQLGTIVWPNGADIAPETLYFGLGPVRASD